MLRRAVTSLVRWEQQGMCSAAAQYSSQAADYALVLKTAAEVGKPALPIPEKEVGLSAGVPLETFQRTASDVAVKQPCLLMLVSRALYLCMTVCMSSRGQRWPTICSTCAGPNLRAIALLWPARPGQDLGQLHCTTVAHQLRQLCEVRLGLRAIHSCSAGLQLSACKHCVYGFAC